MINFLICYLINLELWFSIINRKLKFSISWLRQLSIIFKLCPSPFLALKTWIHLTIKTLGQGGVKTFTKSNCQFFYNILILYPRLINNRKTEIYIKKKIGPTDIISVHLMFQKMCGNFFWVMVISDSVYIKQISA